MNPVEWKKLDKVYFEADSSILKRVGRESISNPIIAIVELIKNSYDSDSEKVKIIFENVKHGAGRIRIIDNGDGMTAEELAKKWMVLAVPDKETNPVTLRKKRVKIGEKGIGRLGLEGLSKKLTIISKPRNSESMFKLEIDWEVYSPGTLLNKVGNDLREAPKSKKNQGFEIILDYGINHQQN